MRESLACGEPYPNPYIFIIAFILALPVLPAACIYGSDDESGAATAERPDAEDRLVVVSGNAAGYEMQITANDSRQTLVIVRKKGTAIEKVDGNGKSW